MTVLTGLTTFTAGTPAVASQVNTNFAAVKSYVDALSAGTNIDNGTIGVGKLSAAATGILSPVGSIVQYIGATEPNANWKICDGQTLLIASYPDLYSLLTTGGTVFPWGANPSATTFVVPNFSGRVPVGKSVDTEFDALGETGGAKTVALTEANLASHNHTQNSHNHTQDAHNHTQNSHNHTQNSHGHTIDPHTHTNQATFSTNAGAHNNTTDYVAGGTNGASTTPSIASISTTNLGANQNTATNNGETATNNGNTATNQAAAATNNPTGSGTAHNNLQPYITVNYIIKVL